MQITKLRLAGFKSFVEPTELRIEPGLTGIVGPNGCGKSNLLEAIRWVMGESSPKSMRSGGMDDVIFTGTSTRPARDFAEVSLTCDTPDGIAAGILADDHDTALEVVRRIDRGAGSAYRANGRDVRAKDIALIFADAATGAHSPALVSQGKIAAVIAARPAERRAMLEEAAGIAGLHVRRKDAEQKLRATETNLARLSELVVDMDNRAANLRRQARAAEKYRALTTAIRTAEARMIFTRWRDAASASDVARAEASAAEEAVATAQQAHDALITGQQTAVQTLAEARAAAQAARDTLSRLTAQHAAADSAARAATQRLADLAVQDQRLTDDRAREGDLAREAQAALTRLDGDMRQLASEATVHTRQRGALEQADQAAQAQLRDAEVVLAQARARAASDAADRRIAQAALDNALGAARRLDDDLARLNDQLAALTAHAALAAASAMAEQEASAAQALTQQQADALEQAEAARADAAHALAETQAACAEARATLAALDSERNALDRALAAGGGAKDRVIDRTRAAPGYEAALAAALGDDLDAGDGPDPGDRRWTLGTQADQSGGPALPPGTQALADFVSAPPALARRLAQIAVVEQDTGQTLAVGQRLVTPAGALRRWDGFISTGSGGPAAQRLTRRNRLDKLERDIPAATAASTALTHQLEDSRAALAQAEATITAARTGQRDADARLRTALRQLDQTRAAQEQSQQRRTMITERQAELAALLAASQADCAARETAIASLPGDALSRDALTTAETQADDARRFASAAREALTTHDRAAAALGERQAVASAVRKSWKDRAGEAVRRLDELDRRHKVLASERDQWADAPRRHRDDAARLAEACTAAQAARGDSDSILMAAEATLQRIEGQLSSAREALASAREGRAGALARADNAEVRRVEMGRLAGERFSCPPPLLPTQAGFDADTVADAGTESAAHDRLLGDRDRLGPVNLVAADELAEVEAERTQSAAEIDELTQAVNRLRGSIGNLNREGRVRLLAAFDTVNGHFQRLFTTLFEGGQAHLAQVDADDPLEAGLEIMAQPPGKRLGSLTLLSGGEQALTAIALIFALFLTNPAPICVLDEVDAPLDDANVGRFCDLLDRMVRETATRYLIVTHNAVTMARMHRLFGVTMVERGVSRLVSVDLGGAIEALAAE